MFWLSLCCGSQCAAGRGVAIMRYQDMIEMREALRRAAAERALRDNEHRVALALPRSIIFPRSPPLCLHMTISPGSISPATPRIRAAGVPTPGAHPPSLLPYTSSITFCK